MRTPLEEKMFAMMEEVSQRGEALPDYKFVVSDADDESEPIELPNASGGLFFGVAIERVPEPGVMKLVKRADD